MLLRQTAPVREGVLAKTLALATFVPTLDSLVTKASKDTSAAAAASAAANTSTSLSRELWLVVDCSGSMGGTPIEQAHQAALFFVRDLPAKAGVKFNITVFGCSHTSLFSAPEVYDERSEARALEWINQRVSADMGGTEILSCLEHIYVT